VTLRNQMLRSFIPLLIVPLAMILVVQLFLTRNYLTAAQRDLLELELQVLRDNFQREYQQQVALQIDSVPFFQNRLLQSLGERFYSEEDQSRGFIVMTSDGTLVRPEILAGSQTVDPRVRASALEHLDGETFILTDGIGGRLSGSMAAGSFYHEPRDWVFLVFNDLSSILIPLTQSAVIITVLSLVGLVIASTAVVAASRRISEPISLLTETVTRFGDGDSSQRSGITGSGEVGVLASEFNTMADSIESFTRDLESRIEERTRELETSVEELKIAQSQLIESEKMAALGGLVAGFAHEINTPIGVTVTAMSYVHDAAEKAVNMVNSGDVSRSELLSTLEKVASAADLGTSNLERASEMVRQFKQVAADQYFEEQREIDLGIFLSEIQDTLITIMKPARAGLSISVPGELRLVTYPGVLWQILSNLARNSLNHAFAEQPPADPRTPNAVRISYAEAPADHCLFFSDNGPGISPESVGKIFDPFFTTRRNEGNTGLGLHIVYNLVSQKLGGRFSYIIPDERDAFSGAGLSSDGACFCIRLPRESAHGA
jgi:C4-dicarboxylate-specific signal transduction histidine kinase